MGKTSGNAAGGKRNAEADLLRLLFAFFIVDFHVGRVCPSGYLAVEFFLMLSGYFTFRKCEEIREKGLPEHPAECAVRMTLKKMVPVFLFIAPVTVLQYFETYLRGVPADPFSYWLGGLYELLGLQTGGLIVEFQMLHFWYLSAMLLSLPVFCYLALKHRDFFLWIIAPLAAVFIYGYFCTSFGTIRHWGKWMGFMYSSVFRAFAGLSLGAIAFRAADRLRGISFTKAGRRLLFILQYACLAVTAFYIWNRLDTPGDFAVIGLIFIFVTIMMSEQTGAAASIRFSTRYLADLSLSVYAVHPLVRNLIRELIPNLYPYKTVVLAAAFAAAVLYLPLIRLLQKLPYRKAADLFVIQKEK